jgi:YVTN family beta-propeller protein
MEFRILGHLEVRDGGGRINVGGPKQKALLALLLLHANEIVSADELIEGLWEEHPPPTAAKTLQAHVSRLRKALDVDARDSHSGGRLEARDHGYHLRVEPGELDVEAFETTLESARRAQAAGDPETASDRVSEALALWRGPPLADLRYESFAQPEIQRLEELRLAAQEEWFDAQLALGRHAEVVPELKTMVHLHPLRERLLGQLMLALYRCDRQAEALQGFEAGRRALANELGLEPGARLRGLERQILEHDPALAPPPRRGRPRIVPRPVWHHPRTLLLLGAAVVVAAVVAGVIRARSDGGREDVTGNAVAAIAGRSADAEAVALPVPVNAMAAGLGFVWAASADSNTVLVVDPTTNTLRDTIPVESSPGGIAVGGGWVWVTNSLTGTVSQISPRTFSVVRLIRVGNGPTGIAADGRYVWVANTSDHTVTQLRARDGKFLRTVPAVQDPGAVAVGADAVWVASKLTSSVVKLSARSGDVMRRIPVGEGPTAIAFGAGSVWVANSLSGTVSRIEPRSGDVRRLYDVGPGANAIAVARGDAWVANGLTDTVTRIQPRDGRIERIVTGAQPSALSSSDGTLYAGFRPSRASHFGGTLRLLFDASPDPPDLDPASAYSPDWWPVVILTNDGLVSWRRVGGQAGADLVPNLALSLPTLSPDRRTYTFQLRRGIRYSDGRLVRSRDVRSSFERLFELKPAPHPAAVGFYGTIVGADRCARQPSRCDLSRGIVTDDRAGTVSFRLARADPEFLFKLAAPFASVLPAGTSPRVDALRPLPATGPYRVASASRSGSVRLVRNRNFDEWSSAAQPRGFADEILIRTGADGEDPQQLVLAGKADYARVGSGAKLPPLSETQLHVQPLAATFYLVFDTARPPFDDVRARRAVSYAVDRGNVARLAEGKEQATCQLLPPNFPAFKPYCPYTLAPARATWSAPDFAKAAALVRASRTSGARIDLWWHRAFGERVGRYLKHMLGSLGYDVRLRVFSDFGKYYGGLTAPRKSWHIAANTWFADYPAPSNFIRLLSCSFDSNYGRFCDGRIDRRIARALRIQERDPGAANRAWSALDRELTAMAVWVPLYTPYGGDLVSKRVGNYQKHPFFGPLFGQFWVR